MKTGLLLVLFAFIFSNPLNLSAQGKKAECGSASFKAIIEIVGVLNKNSYEVEKKMYDIERLYTYREDTVNPIDGQHHEVIMPGLDVDSEYVRLQGEFKTSHKIYADFVVPLIEKNENISELLYLFDYTSEDSFVIKQIQKNKTFQNFATSVAAEIKYMQRTDSVMEKETIRTPRGYYGFWERDTMILQQNHVFTFETLKPLTEYSPAELWWIVRSVEEYERASEWSYKDIISRADKKFLHTKLEHCWIFEDLYYLSNNTILGRGED